MACAVFIDYNIFIMTNISPQDGAVEEISRVLALVGQPARIQILTVIGAQAACVCHLEAVLGMRQASISQHLMVLRKANLVLARRDGRNIFYQLTEPAVLGLIQQAAQLAHLPPETMQQLARRPVQGCPCPQCNPNMDPSLTCGSLR